MNEVQYQEIIAMLTVLYKKIDKLSRSGMRIAPDQAYLDELRAEAQKISKNVTG